MMTDGGKDPQSNQNSDAPFQTGAQDNEAPPGTPAGASPPAFSGSSWSPFYSPVHGGYAGLPAAPDAAQAGSADAGEPQEVDDNELQMAAQDGGPAVEGGGLTTDGQRFVTLSLQCNNATTQATTLPDDKKKAPNASKHEGCAAGELVDCKWV